MLCWVSDKTTVFPARENQNALSHTLMHVFGGKPRHKPEHFNTSTFLTRYLMGGASYQTIWGRNLSFSCLQDMSEGFLFKMSTWIGSILYYPHYRKLSLASQYITNTHTHIYIKYICTLTFWQHWAGKIIGKLSLSLVACPQHVKEFCETGVKLKPLKNVE